MQRTRLQYLLIPLAAFFAIIPLLIHGCSCGHDFDFHLLSWFEAARQFTHGNLHPHWAYTPAYNAGEPRFVFYPPLSWTIGAILGLLFPWTWTPILYTWLALTTAGLSLYYLAREFTTATAATLAAIIYITNPYMLFTAYERTAYAELLAAAWIPLLLHAILRNKVTIPRIAIPIALLWLTNAPAAVMSCYALALLTLTRLILYRPTTNPGAPYLDSETWISRESGSSSSAFARWGEEGATAPAHANIATTPSQTRLQIAINTIAGTILGLGLAAFYILPAAYERRYVQIAMAIIPNMRIQDNFLFHHTGDIAHDHVLHTASLIAIILITLTIVTLAVALLRATKRFGPTMPNRLSKSGKAASSRPDPERVQRAEGAVERTPHLVHADTPLNVGVLFIPLAVVTTTITLLLTPLTSFIWSHTPELPYLQFPWRLLAILAAVLTLTIALALTSFKLKPTHTTILTILIAAALTYPAYAAFHQACDTEDTIQSRVALFHSNQGVEPTDEYTPITADNDSLAQTNPPYWLSTDPNAKAPANTQPGPSPTHLIVEPPTQQNLILNLRNYPAWRIALNGTPIATHTQRDDSLITFPVPAGSSNIDITYAHIMDQTLGDILSLLSVALLLFLVLRLPTHKL